MEVILEMPILTFSNVNIWFIEKKLIWKSYTMQRSCLLSASKKVEFVDRKKFIALALHKSERTIMVSAAVFIKDYSCFLQSSDQFFACGIGFHYYPFQTYQFC